MNESILNSIKKLLGITEDYDYFDRDIIMHINAAFMVLTQLGVGPSKGFLITGDTDTWSNFIDNKTDLGSIKSYVYMKVKLMFDQIKNSLNVDSMSKRVNELEWRLNVAADNSGEEVK